MINKYVTGLTRLNKLVWKKVIKKTGNQKKSSKTKNNTMEQPIKMEANLLESHASYSSTKKSFQNCNFSPRRTRSQTIKQSSPIPEQPQLLDIFHIKKKHHVDEIEKIYLNQKAKVAHKNLETIYEDPKWKKGGAVLLGTSKVKRSLYLDREFRITSKQKSKSRKLKIKKMGKRLKLFKMSNEEFKNKMLRVEKYLNEQSGDVSYENTDCSDVQIEGCDDSGSRNDSEEGVVLEKLTIA